MHKYTIALIALSLFPGQARCSLPSALSYTPVMSDSSKLLVAGTGLTVATALFWFINALRLEAEKKPSSFKDTCISAAQELGRIVLSPIKAAFSLIGIQTKRVEYPSEFSFASLIAAIVSGYCASKFASAFTPEWEFKEAQEELAHLLSSPENRILLKDNRDIIETVKTVFARNDYELVKGKDHLIALSDALRRNYKALDGITISDPKAQDFLAEMKDIACKQHNKCVESVKIIKESPSWIACKKAQQEAADRAAKLALERKKLDLARIQADSAAKQARAIDRQVRAIEYGYVNAHYSAAPPRPHKYYPPVATPPYAPPV